MCAVNTQGASALASVRGPWDPARLTGLPSWPSSTPTSVLLSQQTDKTRNLGTAGFANESVSSDRGEAGDRLCVPNASVLSCVTANATLAKRWVLFSRRDF